MRKNIMTFINEHFIIKRYTIYFLLFSLINLIGCYSYEHMRGTEIREELEQENRRDISIVTKDYKEYQFNSFMYIVVDDSLLGTGTILRLNQQKPFQGKIAVNDITDVEFKNTNVLGSIGMVLGLLTVFGLIVIVIAVSTDK